MLVDSLEAQRNRIKRIDANVARFLRQIGRALVLIFGIVLVMEQFGYNLSTLVAGLGVPVWRWRWQLKMPYLI